VAEFSAAAKARAIRRMGRLHPSITRKVKERLADDAASLVEYQKRIVPVRSGTLRDTIKNEDVSDESRIAQKLTAGGPATTVKVRGGVSDQDFAAGNGAYDYARGVEFGTSDTPALPFFFVAYRNRKPKIQANLAAAAEDGIDEALS
jgi:HK97 gp10 family phage protein